MKGDLQFIIIASFCKDLISGTSNLDKYSWACQLYTLRIWPIRSSVPCRTSNPIGSWLWQRFLTYKFEHLDISISSRAPTLQIYARSVLHLR